MKEVPKEKLKEKLKVLDISSMTKARRAREKLEEAIKALEELRVGIDNTHSLEFKVRTMSNDIIAHLKPLLERAIKVEDIVTMWVRKTHLS